MLLTKCNDSECALVLSTCECDNVFAMTVSVTMCSQEYPEQSRSILRSTKCTCFPNSQTSLETLMLGSQPLRTLHTSLKLKLQITQTNTSSRYLLKNKRDAQSYPHPSPPHFPIGEATHRHRMKIVQLGHNLMEIRHQHHLLLEKD